MRKKKFRAYCYTAKKMFDMDDLISNEHLVDMLEGVEKDEFSPLMQFTGLEDKNGVEIYEADIVKVTDEADEIGGTDTGIGVVEWLDRWGLWNVSKIENGLGDLLYNGYVEVIGNIYEHPHLLEEKD